MFSKACEYGIRATAYIARESKKGNRSSLKEIAKEINSPIAFTAKILQSLSKSEIIHSVKGSAGGYEVYFSELGKLTLCDVVDAIDGNHIYEGCAVGLKECTKERPCPVHFKFEKIRKDLKQMLKNTTLLQLANENSGVATYLN